MGGKEEDAPISDARRDRSPLRSNAHGSYYGRIGSWSVGHTDKVCHPHVVLNLISSVGRHCMKPLCSSGWTGGVARPVIVERLIVEAHHDRHFDDIGEAGLTPEPCLAVRPDQWTGQQVFPEGPKSVIEDRTNIQQRLIGGITAPEVESTACDHTAALHAASQPQPFRVPVSGRVPLPAGLAYGRDGRIGFNPTRSLAGAAVESPSYPTQSLNN